MPKELADASTRALLRIGSRPVSPGIDSAECTLEARARIWKKLAERWKPKQLDTIATEELSLDKLGGAIERILAGRTIGRVLVRPNVPASETLSG